MKKLAILAALPLLSGCIVGTVPTPAVDGPTTRGTAPAAGAAAAPTSLAAPDQNRGREMRKEDERRGREARAMAERCRRGQALPTDVCTQAPPR